MGTGQHPGHIQATGFRVVKCEEAAGVDPLQICVQDPVPPCRYRPVAWGRTAHVPPHPFEALAGTPDSGHQKEHPMNPEPARGVSQHQHQTQRDQPYMWGRPPSTYLPFRAVIRLAILRSKLEAVRFERATWLHSTNDRAA